MKEETLLEGLDPLICEVEDHQAGWRLDKLLAHHFPQLSRTRIQHLIKDGHLSRQNTILSSPSMLVQPGQTYTLVLPPLDESQLVPQSMDLDIVYEDKDLLVVNKPAGLVVHPGAGQPDGTLVNGLLAHCGDSLSGISGIQRPGIVHRLDKGTSGLMVVAKHDQAHHGLADQFEDRSLSRVYVAFVWGVPTPLEGMVDQPLGRHPINRQKMAVRSQGGKSAKTFYTTKTIYGRLASRVECKLETGRTHQIRVHLSHLGHPVMGDPVYGHAPRGLSADLKAMLNTILAPERQALHAHALDFIHPTTGKAMHFNAPLPKDLVMLEETLSSYRV